MPIPRSTRKSEILDSSHRLLYKMDRSKACSNNNTQPSQEIVWDNIVCRFGLTGEIISDNRKQFQDNPFEDWCEKLNIKQRFASVKHPQSNGHVERENYSLGEGIKARLGGNNKIWVEEVSYVLWAHRTMIKTSNRDTLFSLTYGTEVVIPEGESSDPKSQKQSQDGKVLQCESPQHKFPSKRFRPPQQRGKPCQRKQKVRPKMVRTIRGDRSTRERERTSSGTAAEIYLRARGTSKT
nr:reverse transcriptase domain-containing protein [Tanacetum cinerariifolium]